MRYSTEILNIPKMVARMPGNERPVPDRFFLINETLSVEIDEGKSS